MESKIVDEILKAESNADETVKSALLKKEQEIKTARKTAHDCADAALQKMNEENNRLFEEYQKKCDEILKDGRAQAYEAAKKVKEDCEKNREKAVEGIVTFLGRC